MPIPVADLVSTLLLLALIAALLQLQRFRALALGACTLALITSPVLVDVLTRGRYPSTIHFFAPALATLSVMAAARVVAKQKRRPKPPLAL